MDDNQKKISNLGLVTLSHLIAQRVIDNLVGPVKFKEGFEGNFNINVRDLEKAAYGWTPFVPAAPLESGNPLVDTKEVWINCTYQVYVYCREFEGMPFPIVNLSLKTNDRAPVRDWRDLQRIKNELCGTLCEAVELYPAECRLVDTSNQYHLWVLPPSRLFPFGYEGGRFVTSDPDTKARLEAHMEKNYKFGKNEKAVQRPFEEHHTSDDCPAIGPLWASRGYSFNEETEQVLLHGEEIKEAR